MPPPAHATPTDSHCFLVRVSASFSLSSLVIFALPDTLTLLLLPLLFTVRSDNSVMVLCCCITNEPKTEWLKTMHTANLTVSEGQEARHSLTGLLFWGPSQANIMVPVLPTRVQSASKLTQWVLAGGSAHGWVDRGLHSSLVNHWRQPSVPCYVSLSVGSFIRASKRATARQKSQSFISQSWKCHLITHAVFWLLEVSQ